ncbi:MAG TPA: ETC complex I subunit [Nitrospiraceae bacterium]
MQVRIFRPAKTAMQSGHAGTRRWALEFEPDAPRRVEPLMGWTSSADTKAQLRLRFDTKEEAIAYASKHGLMYVVDEPREPQPRPKAYADNFRYKRILPWTH